MESKHKVTQCLFVKHLPKGSDHKDTHFIVLKHVKEDDTFTKELKILENYQRPVWVTKPIHRKYKHKKEYEHEDRLDKIKTTQSDMPYAVCRALGKETSNYNIRNIKDSPYIYGMDVPSTAFIKEIYDIKSDNYFRAFDILNLDIEFDVTGKYNDVSIVTLSMPGLRHTFALRRLYKNIGNDEYVINKIKTMSLELLPDSEAKKICKVYNVTLYNNDLDLLKAVFKMVHELSPDIATFHNIVYDISRITERLEFWNVKPEDLFSDPSVPENQRYFIFKKAKTSKEKKGKKYSIPIEEQWTTVDFPAKFMLMDNMTTYDAIRQGGGKVVGGYGLDNLLKKNGVEGKLFYTDEFTENLTKTIEMHFDALTKDKKLPIFVLNEIKNNDNNNVLDIIREIFRNKISFLLTKLDAILQEEIKAKRIREISALDLVLTIVSLNIFVFLAYPIVDYVLSVNEKGVELIIQQRKKEIVNTILNSLRP